MREDDERYTVKWYVNNVNEDDERYTVKWCVNNVREDDERYTVKWCVNNVREDDERCSVDGEEKRHKSGSLRDSAVETSCLGRDAV